MSTELLHAEPFNMLNQPRGPYRLTKQQFDEMPVSEIRREKRKAILNLARALYSADLSGTDCELVTQDHELAKPINHFSAGIYARELRMPAGLRVVGMRHAQEHINIISKGRATVVTEEGAQEIEAPCTFISPAGTQRFVWVHEDTIWTTIHRTDETDLSKIVDSLTIHESLHAEVSR